MAKFSKNSTKLAPNRGPVKAVAETSTFNGAKGFSLDDKSALFFLAATNMVGEKSFYESAAVRDERFKQLVHSVTRSDPEWVARFIPYLRNEMNMRSAAIVMAAEYVAAGGPNARQVVSSAMSRADEPAEFLGYWARNYYGWDGKSFPLPAPKIPQAVRKGLNDAVNRLYTERATLKWNGNSREIGFGNVLDLVHPKPADEKQSALFKYIVDRHHGNDTLVEGLDIISEFNRLNALPQEQRRSVLETPWVLRKAGFTWESLSGWLGGPMDAKAWEAMIEAGMGYMALLRNLRNFGQAGISQKYVKLVIDKLTNDEEIAGSRQLPFRFLSAFKELEKAHNVTYLAAVEYALDRSVQNIPEFNGRTLVLTDVSGSMTWSNVSDYSSLTMMEVGALFGTALYYKNREACDFVAFATSSGAINLPAGGSVLKGVKTVVNDRARYGGGTEMWHAINKHYNGHDRIVILSDMQCDFGSTNKKIPVIHAYDLKGYNRTPFKIGDVGRYQYGGFSDKSFGLMKSLETVQHGTWPF